MRGSYWRKQRAGSRKQGLHALHGHPREVGIHVTPSNMDPRFREDDSRSCAVPAFCLLLSASYSPPPTDSSGLPGSRWYDQSTMM